VLPRCRRPAGHDGRTLARPLLATGDPGADVEQALGLDPRGSPDGVVVVGVAAIDDDVTLIEQTEQSLDEIVHRLAGLDQQHHSSGCGERINQLLDTVGADNLGALGVALDELIDHLDGAVEDRHLETVIVHVEDQVLAHDREPDEPEVGFVSHSLLRYETALILA